jgi:nitrate reductase gamma subunit
LAVLVAVFVWFSGVVAALGSVSAMALVLGSAAALAALAGVVLTISLWHRRRIRSAVEAICDRYTAPSERDDAIAVLYEMRESSLAAGEVLEALEVQRQKRSDKTL